jgi:hypothetical protein
VAGGYRGGIHTRLNYATLPSRNLEVTPIQAFVGFDFPDQGILPRNRLDVSAMPNAVYDSITTIKERVMRENQLFVLMAAIGSAWLLSSCATTSPTSAAAETARITVLYDAFGKDAAMTKDWGYAAPSGDQRQAHSVRYR